MPPTDRQDPFFNANFRLEIDDFPVATFSEVSGLTSTGDIIEYRNGDDVRLTTRKIPGLRKFGPLVLKRGVIQDTSLWDWYRSVVNGVVDRKDGSVILMNEAGQDVVRWNFTDAWPNQADGPALKGDGKEVAIESIQLVVEDIQMVVG